MRKSVVAACAISRACCIPLLIVVAACSRQPEQPAKPAAAPAADAADIVFRGGVVYTVDAARSVAEAAAVRGGKVVAVGSAQDVGALIGPKTEVVELAGGMLLPGFEDA